jgi:hypothetical protein
MYYNSSYTKYIYMNSIIEIINNIKLPIIIWENKVCIHTNYSIIKKGVTLQEYMNIEYINNYNTYVDNVINNKTCVKIKTYSKIICIEYLSPTSYYEIHYPLYLENELIGVAIYKLRKSLTDIINYIHIDSQRNNETNELLKHTCQIIMSLTNDMIDVFHINKNKLTFDNQYFYIDQLIDECINYISIDSNKKNLQVTKFVSPIIKTKLYTDYSKTKQVILNILDNSIKFTNIGGIFINVEYYDDNIKQLPIKTDLKYICIIIKDTGLGMTDDTKRGLSMLMNIQNDDKYININHKKLKLEGFGLYISYHMCRFLKGYLTFKSDQNMGSVFYIIIPEDINN